VYDEIIDYILMMMMMMVVLLLLLLLLLLILIITNTFTVSKLVHSSTVLYVKRVLVHI
jgi:uncharacterized integral membrane protein